jgi:O-antigen/teichoic acid export membrane protein
MLRRVLGDSIVYGSSRVLMTAVGALLVPIYSRVLQRSDYGAIETFNMFTAIALLILPCGLPQAIYRFADPGRDPDDARRTYSTTFTFLLCVAVLFLALGIVFRRPLAILLIQDLSFVRVQLLAIASVAFALLHGYCLETLRSQFRRTAYVALSVGAAVLLSCLGIYFVAVRGQGVEGFFLAAALAHGAALLAGVTLNRAWLRLSIDWTRLKVLLQFGLPLVPAALALVLMRFADRLVVQRFVGLDALGLYAMGTRVSGLYDLVGTAFALAWFPYAMRSLQEGDARAMFRDAFPRVLWGLALAAGAFCSVADWLVWAFVDPKFWEATTLVQPLVLASMLSTLNYIIGLGIYASKRTGYALVATLVGGVTNLVCSIIGVRTVGLLGVAAAAAIGAAAYLLSSHALSQRLYPIAYDIRRGGLIIFALVTWMGVLWATKDSIEPSVVAFLTRALLFAAMLTVGVRLGVMSRETLSWAALGLRRRRAP